MDPLKDFETQNAKAWDRDSTITASTTITRNAHDIIAEVAASNTLIDLAPELQAGTESSTGPNAPPLKPSHPGQRNLQAPGHQIGVTPWKHPQIPHGNRSQPRPAAVRHRAGFNNTPQSQSRSGTGFCSATVGPPPGFGNISRPVAQSPPGPAIVNSRGFGSNVQAVPPASSVLVDLTSEPQITNRPPPGLGSIARGFPPSSFANTQTNATTQGSPGAQGARPRENTYGNTLANARRPNNAGYTSGPAMIDSARHVSDRGPAPGQAKGYDPTTGKYRNQRPRAGKFNLENAKPTRASAFGTPKAALAAAWAPPSELVTRRRAEHRVQTAFNEQERNKYCQQPAGNEDFPATGYYIWPNFNEKPGDLFGWKLELLDPVRREFKVWIEWIDAVRSLKISSRSTDRKNQDEAILEAIEGIRAAVRSVNARNKSAAPMHLLEPPMPQMMRAAIRPVLLNTEPQIARDLKMVGEELSQAAQDEWGAEGGGRERKVYDNLAKLEQHLVRHMMALAPMKSWMRMRLHFGHMELNSSTNDFREGKLSFEQFESMLQMKRTSGVINRNLGDGMMATKLIEAIISRDEEYGPANGQITSSQNVPFNEKVVLHAILPTGEKVRIEGSVDKISEQQSHEVQMGSLKVFRDSKIKLLEVRTIDIDSKLDWKLEIISESKKIDTYEVLARLMKECLPVHTKFEVDTLGLPYPKITPSPPPEVIIHMTEVRSTIQFKRKDSGYVVEIGVYRKWQGTNTKGDPNIDVKVSMFHPDWDANMEAVHDQAFGRDWSADLSQFFPKFTVEGQSGWPLQYFWSEIQAVQDIVAEAQRDALTFV